MAPAGLLFLLLVSSSLFFSAVSVPDEHAVVARGKFIRQNLDRFDKMVVPFLRLIPDNGALVAAITSLLLKTTLDAMGDKSMLDVIKSEFRDLESKMTINFEMQKWEIWTAAAFHDPELVIVNSWREFEKLVNSLDQQKAEKDRLRQRFLKEDCTKVKKATQDLHTYLTTVGVSFIKNLAKMLTEHVNCHPKELRGYTLLIQSLVFKGNTMMQFCYDNKKPKPSADSLDIKELAEFAYKAGSVMFEIHKHCISNVSKYVEKDVVQLISQSKHRLKQAHDIWAFLAKTYDIYDWMVVVFLTKHSSYPDWRSFNKHTLTRFTEVNKDGVTVAVVRQVKGTHTHADKVKRAIPRCFGKMLDCHKIGETLEKCEQAVEGLEGVKVPKSYSAVHAYIDRPHASQDAKPAPDEVYANPMDNTIPYIYTGDCKKYKVNKNGKFVVLIKSDEEMTNQDPCKKKECGGQRGTCLQLQGTFIGVCECKAPYYGESCEDSLENYKKEFLEKLKE